MRDIFNIISFARPRKKLSLKFVEGAMEKCGRGGWEPDRPLGAVTVHLFLLQRGLGA